MLKSRRDLPSRELPGIVRLAALRTDQYEVHKVQNFDDLNDCYLFAIRLIERLHKESPDAAIVVDYTGGTKSMTARLATPASDDGRCEICIVTGLRQNPIQVSERTQFVRPSASWTLR